MSPFTCAPTASLIFEKEKQVKAKAHPPGASKILSKAREKVDQEQKKVSIIPHSSSSHSHLMSSVTGMLSQLEWVPLATRRANIRLCMMYRVAHMPVGDPWTPWLTFAQRSTRGSHAWKYIPISTSHDAYKFSFLPRTIIAWNQLPSIIITAPSLEAFRSRLITSQPKSINPTRTRTRSMHTQIAQTTLHPTIALFIVLSPPRQPIMLAQADNAPSVERQLFN